MIKRTFDADRVNEIVNAPTIRPYIGGDPEAWIDLSAAVADDQNFFLMGDQGGFSCVWTAPETFEVHTFILPDGRGQWAIDAVKNALGIMKEHAAVLWTRVHPDARHTRIFTLKAGFKPCGRHRADFGAGTVEFDLFNWRY